MVLKDPESLGSEEGIQAATKAVIGLKGRIKDMTGMINHIELIRKQLSELKTRLDGGLGPLSMDIDKLDTKLIDVESVFFDPHITGSGDSFYYPPKLYTKVQYLGY